MHNNTQKAQVFDTPEGIRYVCLSSLKGRLNLEKMGLKCRGPAATTIAKRNFGFKGNRESIIKQIEAEMQDLLERKQDAQ